MPIIGLSDIIAWLERQGDRGEDLEKMRVYREKWGAEEL